MQLNFYSGKIEKLFMNPLYRQPQGRPCRARYLTLNGVRRVGKLTPPGTRRCLSCDSTVGRVSTSPFLYNNSIDKNRTLRNADKAQVMTLVTRQAVSGVPAGGQQAPVLE